MYQYNWPRPAVTSDVVIFRDTTRFVTEVLLIERGVEPFLGQFALPGGHVSEHESFKQCAVRELREETGIDITEHALQMVGIFDAAHRDPRGWTITTAYTANVGKNTQVVAGDDAKSFKWVPISELFVNKNLAFDHYDIICAAYQLHGKIYWGLQ